MRQSVMKLFTQDKVFLYAVILVVLAAAVGLFWVTRPPEKVPHGGLILERESGVDASQTTEEEPEKEEELPTQQILHNVPFAAQAPFGEWSDPRQQDGCEEAASLMAVSWARGETITPAHAKAEILAISAYEQATYGTYHDSSAADTLSHIIKGYFGYENARLETDITKRALIDELYAGNVVIVPTDGRALQNPNFTNGGPDRHMLVVIGYDPTEGVFITNDNGTRQGAGWRYDEDLFFGAIRDYATGEHEPIVGRSKVMIVVSVE